MSNTFTRLTAPATGSVAMWTLIHAMVTAGWTKPMDSDGTTYSAAGTQVTHGGSGAHGLGNARAWVRLAHPSGFPEIIFWHHTNAANNKAWLVVYDGAIPMEDSPSATVRPSAVGGEFYILGGDGPIFTTFFGPDGSYQIDVISQNSANYDFALFVYDYTSTGDTSAYLFTSADYAGFYNCGNGEYILAQQDTALLATAIPPTATPVDPASGGTVTRNDPLRFLITSVTHAFASLCLIATFPSGKAEVIHDGVSFSGQYDHSSTRTAVAQGFEFAIYRDGGWPQTPAISVVGTDSNGTAFA